ncbi:hypothetical protein ACQ4PT_059033 [Festuca glaucescens]
MERMKQRLLLKATQANVEPILHQPLVDEQPLASEHPAEDVHVGRNVQDEGAGACKVEKRNQSNLFNRAPPMKIVTVCKGMTIEQRDLLIATEFGNFIGVKCSKLNRELCRFLMGCFDPEPCALDFSDRGRIPITDESVYKVMGVPWGSIPIAYHLDGDATSLILKMFGIQNGQQPMLTTVEEQLGKEYPADQAYIRKFIIYVICFFFAPTTGTKVSPRRYPCVIDTEAIRSLNWHRFIVQTIIQTAKAKDRKNWFKASKFPMSLSDKDVKGNLNDKGMQAVDQLKKTEDEEEEDQLSPLISQRCHLTDGENEQLLQIIPPSNSIIAVPFVTCLTSTNVERRLMKLPKYMVSHLDIPQDGLVGLCVGAQGGITTVEYKTDLDGCISFTGEGWRNFLQTEHLQIGQAILITARLTKRRHMQMMFVIDIINDLSSSSKSESDSDSEECIVT